MLWLARLRPALLAAAGTVLCSQAAAQEGAPAPPPQPPPPPQPYSQPYAPYPPGYGAYSSPGYGARASAPAQPPAEQFPKDAAARASPYVDFLFAGYELRERFADPYSLGAQLGVYLFKRVRLAGRLVFPLHHLADKHSESSAVNYQVKESDSPHVLYGASAGVVVVSTVNFVLSPGVLLVRSDNSDYGTVVGLSLPLEWVTRGHFRFGTEIGVGSALGGSRREECINVGVIPAPCNPGDSRELDRSAGLALYAQFQVGWAFSYPNPETQPAASTDATRTRPYPQPAPRWQIPRQ